MSAEVEPLNKLGKTTLFTCALLASAVCGGCSRNSAIALPGNGQPAFRDVTAQAGIRFAYDNDASPAHRFIETTGGGCAFIDFDNDGLLDILAVQSGPAPGNKQRSRPPHALYRNQGNGRYEDVAAKVGLAVDVGYAQGVAAADYDNDGWTDVLITAYGGPHLFHNDHGRFRDVTAAAGINEVGGERWSTSAAWADYDRDGYLDLFICRYAGWSPEVDHPCRDDNDRLMYCQPTEFAGDTSVLYHNNRHGGFDDVSKKAGIGRLEGKALGAAWLDYDTDGWPDLFVANDMLPNRLFRNNGMGALSDLGARAGVATGPTGLPLSGMGVAVADFAGTGRESLFVVNFSLQPRSYYLNQGKGTFSSAASWAGVGDADQPYLAFGLESLDYDLDGCPDLVIGNGHLNRLHDTDTGEETDRQRQQLLHNRGDGRFDDDRQAAGDLTRPRVTRGLAVGDYDNDGRPDVLVSGPGSPLSLFHNLGATQCHWIGFRLAGMQSNRDGIGARVIVTTGANRQVRVVRSGSSYCSRSDIRPLFGLGTRSGVDQVEIEWPSGVRQVTRSVVVDRYNMIKEPLKEPFRRQ